MLSNFSIFKEQIRSAPLFSIDLNAGENSTQVVENNLDALSDLLDEKCAYEVFRQVHVAITELIFLSGRLTVTEKIAPDSKLEMIDDLLVSIDEKQIKVYFAAKTTYDSSDAKLFIEQLSDVTDLTKKQLKKRIKSKIDNPEDSEDLIPIGLLEIHRMVASPVLHNYFFEKSCLELILTFE